MSWRQKKRGREKEMKMRGRGQIQVGSRGLKTLKEEQRPLNENWKYRRFCCIQRVREHTLMPLPICFLMASPPRETRRRITTHACSLTLLSLSEEAEAKPCCHMGIAAAMSSSVFVVSSKKEFSSARALSFVVGSRFTSFFRESTAYKEAATSPCQFNAGKHPQPQGPHNLKSGAKSRLGHRGSSGTRHAPMSVSISASAEPEPLVSKAAKVSPEEAPMAATMAAALALDAPERAFRTLLSLSLPISRRYRLLAEHGEMKHGARVR